MFLFPLLLSSLFQFTLFNEVRKILDIILYIKLLFPISNQFSIDCFLDREGRHWDISLITHITLHSRTSVSILTPHTLYMLI